jgi:hypothetical protein
VELISVFLFDIIEQGWGSRSGRSTLPDAVADITCNITNHLEMQGGAKRCILGHIGATNVVERWEPAIPSWCSLVWMMNIHLILLVPWSKDYSESKGKMKKWTQNICW